MSQVTRSQLRALHTTGNAMVVCNPQSQSKMCSSDEPGAIWRVKLQLVSTAAENRRTTRHPQRLLLGPCHRIWAFSAVAFYSHLKSMRFTLIKSTCMLSSGQCNESRKLSNYRAEDVGFGKHFQVTTLYFGTHSCSKI